MQNKLHFAATGKTAPEIIAGRADAGQPNMGLTSWKGSKVLKTDVTVAKNYLQEEEISELNRIVVMFLDYAEDQAKRRKQVFMANWKEKLDEFLRFNERNVLPDAGKVSREAADEKAEREYEPIQRAAATSGRVQSGGGGGSGAGGCGEEAAEEAEEEGVKNAALTE